MLQIQSLSFKGHLTSLIGLSKAEALSENPVPFARVEGWDAERFFWMDWVSDDETNERLPILYMVRFFRGRAWAVGIRSKSYLFPIEVAPDGSGDFVAVPKGPEHDPDAVVWVCRRAETLYNLGVGY